MTQTPTLAQLIKQAIDHRLMDVHTALIAKVEKYDAEKQQVDVLPVLKSKRPMLDGYWKSESLPVLCDVPVLFPRAGGFFISFPIQSGDFVQLIFNETSIEEWIEGLAPTVDYNQRFSLHGATAIPGVYPSSKALTGAHKTNFVLGREKGLQIHIDGKKIRLGSAEAREALALAKSVEKELKKIHSAFLLHVHTSHGAITTTTIGKIGNIATTAVVAE